MTYPMIRSRPRATQETEILKPLIAILACLLFSADVSANAVQKPLSFAVMRERSAILTAQYWNPILQYIGQRSGVPLQLKLVKTDAEYSAMIRRGEFDFIYTNYNFIPENEAAGYKVFARPVESSIRSQIIVLADSPLRTLADLQGKDVAFPSTEAFTGYQVPMDALLHTGIQVKPLFSGTQEGALGQLVSGRVAAAGVNSQVAREFARRQEVSYRMLWSSEEYPNIPLSVHPSVPKAVVQAVRDAFIGMETDPQGAKILAAAGGLMHRDPPYGFVAAADADFNNVRRFYKNSLVRTTAQ
jgi:phosphonate transport system substrate-binding protein